MPGFGNDFETEALTGALPQGMNSPQRVKYGLYAEQLSGTAFTKPHPERTWCYRIQPSVRHTHRFKKIDVPYWKSAPHVLDDVVSLGQYRWDPLPHSEISLNWINGMRTITTAGDVNTQNGMAAHVYLVNQSMVDEYFYSADREVESTVNMKWCGQFHKTRIDHSPLDIVAWHGNYAPYKYDLKSYCPVGAVLFDHPDPSIFTVLTAPSGHVGTANIDFVLFCERWMVAENTFRPPWYHKNLMSELMGNIYGEYDAKPTGFVPGGMSLHT